MLIEMLAKSGKLSGPALWRAIIPGFVAAGTGALVFTGVGDLPGLHEFELAIPGVPDYPSVRLVDLVWAIPVAIGAAIAVSSARRLARLIAHGEVIQTRPEVLLVGAGLLVGLIAVGFRWATDQPVDLVLFSGQDSMGPLITEDTGWVLALVFVAKGLAYALSLGSGFRGGPIFPAVALGAATGVLASIVLPGSDLTPALAAGLAAGAAAALQLPIFGALLAFLLLGDAGAEAIPVAVLAAVVGWLVATAIDARIGEGTEDQGPADAPVEP
jgi:H+/Cl- antiporter ClcA